MLRIVLLAAVLLAPIAAAQAPGRGDLNVRFLAERVPRDLGKVVLVQGDLLSEPFDLPINHLSEPVKPPARAFGVRSEEKKVELATVKLPAEGRSFIVLLVPSATGGYKPVVVPAEDPSFKAGDVYFYNHGDKPVMGYVGTATFTLKPDTGQVLRPSGARPEKFYDVGFGVREEGQDRALSTTRWPVEERMRSYVFFFMNPTTKRLDFRAVDEFVPPPAAVP